MVLCLFYTHYGYENTFWLMFDLMLIYKANYVFKENNKDISVYGIDGMYVCCSFGSRPACQTSANRQTNEDR